MSSQRRHRGADWSDIVEVEELVSLWSKRIFGSDLFGRAHLTAVWSQRNFSPEGNCRLIHNDCGRIVAYATVSPSGNGFLHSLSEIKDEALLALLGWLCGDDTSSPRRLHIAEDAVHLSRELEHRGLTVVERLVHSTCNLDNIRLDGDDLHHGVSFVPYTADLSTIVHAIVQEAFLSEHYQPRNLEDWVRLAQTDGYQPRFWKLIEVGNLPIAVALGRLCGNTGHITHIAVRNSYQSRGFGGIALAGLLREFKMAGANVALVQYALPRSFAAHCLYQKVGFLHAGEIFVYSRV